MEVFATWGLGGDFVFLMPLLPVVPSICRSFIKCHNKWKSHKHDPNGKVSWKDLIVII